MQQEYIDITIANIATLQEREQSAVVANEMMTGNGHLSEMMHEDAQTSKCGSNYP